MEGEIFQIIRQMTEMTGKNCQITKGHIISKGLFDVLEFSQKTNERIFRSSKNEFVRSFFGENR